MNAVKFIIPWILSIISSMADYSMPPEIGKAIASGRIGESLGYIVPDIDRSIFDDHIKKNWRNIADNVEILPLASSPYDGQIHDYEISRSASAASFAAACEVLPPMEYLDFLDKWLDLFDQDRITYRAVNSGWGGVQKKIDFLSVNWEHPRVQIILKRALKLVPANGDGLYEVIEAMAQGELADAYRDNKSDSAPNPETLPGIKLQRPFASTLALIERLTGKEIPDDPHFGPRPERRIGAAGSSLAPEIAQRPASSFWQWLIGGLVVVGGVFAVWRMKRAV